jgi:PAS domain S-box-containing protein
MANKAADRLLGHDGWRDAQGHLTPALFHPDGRPYDPQDLPLLRSALSGETFSNLEMVVAHKGGERRDLLMNSVPLLDAHGKPTGAVIALSDITERVRVEVELHRHREHLEDLVTARTAELRDTNQRLEGEVAERKRTEEMLRQVASRLRVTNQRILTLGRVGLKVQQTLRVDEVYEVVTEELRKMGFASFILLRQDEWLLVRHLSVEPERLARLEALGEFRVDELSIPVDTGDLLQSAQSGNAHYFADPIGTLTKATSLHISDEVRAELEKMGLTRAICAPLGGQSGFVGMLCICAGDLGQGDVPAIMAIANQLAIAVENATLFQASAQQREQLRALTSRLAEVEEVERRQVAQDLHDQVGQTLSVLGINLSFLRAQLPEALLQTLGPHLDDSMKLVEQTIDRTRDVMADLRPPVLDDYGLVAALRWYSTQFATRTGIAIELEGSEPSPRMSPPLEIALFRIAQEALTNVAKHAEANRVTITVSQDGDVLLLEIHDDGVGFDAQKLAEPDSRTGWGLISMRERVEAVGGRLQIQSVLGQGTQLLVEVKR